MFILVKKGFIFLHLDVDNLSLRGNVQFVHKTLYMSVPRSIKRGFQVPLFQALYQTNHCIVLRLHEVQLV